MSNRITVIKLTALAVDVEAAKDIQDLKKVVKKLLNELDKAFKEINVRLEAEEAE